MEQAIFSRFCSEVRELLTPLLELTAKMPPQERAEALLGFLEGFSFEPEKQAAALHVMLEALGETNETKSNSRRRVYRLPNSIDC